MSGRRLNMGNNSKGVIRLKRSILLIIAALLLSGCAPGAHGGVSPSQTGAAQSTAPGVMEIPFAAQYIRTDGYVSGKKYPVTTVIRSVSELEEYYDANRDTYNLGDKDSIRSESSERNVFADAAQKYDGAYFESNALILILLEEPSGSIRHNVSSVTDGNGLDITIERLLPEEGTCDMAEWHIFVEIAKDKASDNVTVTFTDVNIR
jgi:hypothetical protein